MPVGARTADRRACRGRPRAPAPINCRSIASGTALEPSRIVGDGPPLHGGGGRDDRSPRRRDGRGGHQRVLGPWRRAPRRDNNREAIGAVRSATGTCSDGCGRGNGAAALQDGSPLRTAACVDAVAGRRAGAAAPRSGRRPRTAARGGADEMPVSAPTADQRACRGRPRAPVPINCRSTRRWRTAAPRGGRRSRTTSRPRAPVPTSCRSNRWRRTAAPRGGRRSRMTACAGANELAVQ